MSDSRTTYTNGIGFTGLLTLVFIVLKLTGVIAWAWFWVLFPTILTTLLLLLVVIFVIWVVSS